MDYSFSGPSGKIEIFEVEVEACVHVMHKLSGMIRDGSRALICSDSVEAIKFLLSLKFDSVDNNLVPADIIQVLKLVDLKAINRKFNLQADGLAKKGISRAILEEKWKQEAQCQ